METDKEREQFHADLLEGVRDMKAGRAGRITQVEPTVASIARAKSGLTQGAFAKLLGVSLRTFQEWEQGRREPTGAAQTLLRVAVQHPEALKDLQAA
ncbi:helix-turn-helix domain-containing protein [Burkholderia anthina]|uniref:helix-turn-helix domain-containing protein n=1 Tax=Burkholderia anthina TaxID=179879 RepID=UPI00158A75BD|nr:type II toxin-antitoxin system MqsA family antitoxin [Burkholderia anthina]